MTPNEIRLATKRDTRVRKLQRKNYEFLLAPSRESIARIPADAVVR